MLSTKSKRKKKTRKKAPNNHLANFPKTTWRLWRRQRAHMWKPNWPMAEGQIEYRVSRSVLSAHFFILIGSCAVFAKVAFFPSGLKYISLKIIYKLTFMCAAFFLFNTWNSSWDSSNDAVSSETLKETKQKISSDKKTMNVNMNVLFFILTNFCLLF